MDCLGARVPSRPVRRRKESGADGFGPVRPAEWPRIPWVSTTPSGVVSTGSRRSIAIGPSCADQASDDIVVIY